MKWRAMGLALAGGRIRFRLLEQVLGRRRGFLGLRLLRPNLLLFHLERKREREIKSYSPREREREIKPYSPRERATLNPI